MKDNLIKEFNQERVMKSVERHLDILSSSPPGACHSFTVSWLGLMFADSSISTRTVTSRIEEIAYSGGNANRLLQKMYKSRVKELRKNKMPDAHADRMLLCLRGLKEVALPFDYKTFQQTDLIESIKQPESSGLIYSFWFSGGAHTIGLFLNTQAKRGKLSPSDDYVSVFDPNYGEYHIPSKQLNDWFNKYKSSYRGSFTQHSLKFVTKQ